MHPERAGAVEVPSSGGAYLFVHDLSLWFERGLKLQKPPVRHVPIGSCSGSCEGS